MKTGERKIEKLDTNSDQNKDGILTSDGKVKVKIS